MDCKDRESVELEALQTRREGLIAEAMKEIREGVRLQEQVYKHDEAARLLLGEVDKIDYQMKHKILI